MRESLPRMVFVSGLSGSGKSTAMAALEDIGFYCADNLPVQLVDQFLDLCAKSSPPVQKIALALVADLADHVIDTSRLNVHQLRAAVVQHVSGKIHPIVVNLVSFGFRYGTPQTMELLFDVRFLPNPHFDDRLRERTGRERDVSTYVLENPRGTAFFDRLCDWLDFLLPLYDAEGKAYLTVGFGCTGGRHRSVAVAEAAAAVLRDRGREVNVDHRDVERGA